MTYAKGVYAWLAAGMLFLVLPRRLAGWRFWIALVAPLVGITLLVWLAIDAVLRGDLQYGTIISRLELWFSAIDILQSDRFVLVLGSGGPQLLSKAIVSFDYPNPHNAWLSQALTYGAPALVLYLAAFVSAFGSLARQLRWGDGVTTTVGVAAMASLMALLGENFFEPADRGSTYQAQLLLLFAVAVRAGVGDSRSAARRGRRDLEDHQQQADGEQTIAGEAGPGRTPP
jgi:O-antigen ligase